MGCGFKTSLNGPRLLMNLERAEKVSSGTTSAQAYAPWACST